MLKWQPHPPSSKSNRIPLEPSVLLHLVIIKNLSSNQSFQISQLVIYKHLPIIVPFNYALKMCRTHTSLGAHMNALILPTTPVFITHTIAKGPLILWLFFSQFATLNASPQPWPQKHKPELPLSDRQTLASCGVLTSAPKEMYISQTLQVNCLVAAFVLHWICSHPVP